MTWTTQFKPWKRALTRRQSGELVKCEKGGTAVEFAFLMPVFLLLLSGIVQFGLVMFVQNNMSHVARDTSRRLAVGELTAAEAQTTAQGSLVNWGIDYTVQVVEPDPSDPDDRDVTVFISAPLEQAALFDILGILGGSDLAASVTMRLES